MFEEFFHDFVEIRQNKIIEETKKAQEEYNKMKERNPSMITTNANMGLINNSPNSYISYYNNPYSNPNIIPPMGNPYVYNRPTISTGVWRNIYYNNSYDYTSNFMIPSDEEVRSGKNTRGRVSIEDDIIDIPTDKHISYDQKVSGKDLKVSVTYEQIKEEKQDSEIKELYGIKYIETKLDLKKHPPNVPFTEDELKQNTIRILVKSPLIWSQEDEDELSILADMIAVYDKALAHIIWNIPCNLNSISREEYNYCKIYCRNLIQEYRSNEIMQRNIDFKATYRHRELPESYIDENGNEIVDMNKPYPYARLSISIYGEILSYEYDRERDELTEREWNLFLDRAYIELMNGIKILQEKDFAKINESLVETPNNTQQQSLPSYNPYDPISVKLYNMKQIESGYNTNMEFFKYALRHKFQSNEQFDNWWYGTKSQADFVKNRNNPEYYRNYQESSWKRQMTENNISNLNRFVPLDNQIVAQQYNQRAYQEINKFTNGNLNQNMSMTDIVNNLSYLDNRIHEMNVEQNIDSYKKSFVYGNGQSIINKNMFNHMLYEFHNNDNPNYSSSYGATIDPRMGVPDIIKDYTQEAQDSYNDRFKRFQKACNQMKEFQLNSAGVLT